MKNIYDCHIHSAVSFDSAISIDSICREYAARGISGLIFTEHIERREPLARDITFDKNEYRELIGAARAAYPQLEIGMGIELGLVDYAREAVLAESRGPWDFILGSIHVLDGCRADMGYLASGKSKKKYIGDYFAALARAVAEMPCFDVLGHLDLFLRDADIGDKTISYRDYHEEADRLFTLLIEKGIGVEVNTGGLRYGMKSPHPQMSLLKRYRELGGELVTVGSDSHNQKSLGYRLEDGYRYLEEAGFSYFTVYKDRKPRQLPIK